MGKVKDLYIEEHERLCAEYLKSNPWATVDEAYEATAEAVDGAVEDRMATATDAAYEEHKERRREYPDG